MKKILIIAALATSIAAPIASTANAGIFDWFSKDSMYDLVRRDGLFYMPFSNVPYTGQIDEGYEHGSFKNGKQDGLWFSYYDNGQLMFKGKYKNGKREGRWVYYYRDGTVDNVQTATY